MTAKTATGILVKLFMGCELTTGLRILLDHNPAWKMQQIMPKAGRTVDVVTHQHKEYLGVYLNETEVSVDELKRLQGELVKNLQEFLPETPIEPHKIFIFTQSLIS